jgi:hypothetical protein
MRKLVPLLTGVGLVATAAAASAEPAKLSEGELGQVAAGQNMDLNVQMLEAVTDTVTTTTATNDNDSATSIFHSDATAAQELVGGSTNSVSALGMLDSRGVTAIGDANAIVSGTIANTVP